MTSTKPRSETAISKLYSHLRTSGINNLELMIVHQWVRRKEGDTYDLSSYRPQY
jgi:hypothetical protein